MQENFELHCKLLFFLACCRHQCEVSVATFSTTHSFFRGTGSHLFSEGRPSTVRHANPLSGHSSMMRAINALLLFSVWLSMTPLASWPQYWSCPGGRIAVFSFPAASG